MLALAALLGEVIAAPGARAADITRGGKPAELTVTRGGAHSIRVTLKPVGMVLSPSPSLLNLEIKNPAISLRTIDKPVKARVGALDVEITHGLAHFRLPQIPGSGAGMRQLGDLGRQLYWAGRQVKPLVAAIRNG
jgi:hypothetical protein